MAASVKKTLPGKKSGMTNVNRVGLARMVKASTITAELLERTIARDPRAVREFVAVLTPIFWARIGRVLVANGNASRNDAADLCQDTFVALLQDDCRLVRSWDPARSSFENFSGLIAEQRAIEKMRKRKEEILDEETPWEDLGLGVDSSRAPDRLASSREIVRKSFDTLNDELSELGRKLLELLFVEEREVTDVCDLLKMEKEAVYAWRSRLGRRLQQIAATIGGGE
ncbi:MAG TPA: sigma factor [Polyangium sp.]|nr:sigma factor [Polyangium sp.]